MQRALYLAIFVATILSVAVVPYLAVQSQRLYESINFKKLFLLPVYEQEVIIADKAIEKVYADVSGSGYLILSVLFCVASFRLNRTLK